MKRVGVQDCFGQVGLTEDLKKAYGLTAENIITAAKEVISQK